MRFEIEVDIDAFECWDVLDCASSPHPTAYFEYSKNLNKYVLANRKFSKFILEDLDKSNISEIKSYLDSMSISNNKKAITPYYAISNILSVLLDYIYAGQRLKGCNSTINIQQPR